MKYIPDTAANLSDVRAAFAKADGCPRRATGIHPAAASLVPAVYSPGAFGWTDQVMQPALDIGDGTAVLEVYADAEKYAGAKVTVNAKLVTIATPVDAALLSKAAVDKLTAVGAVTASADVAIAGADVAAVKS